MLIIIVIIIVHEIVELQILTNRKKKFFKFRKQKREKKGTKREEKRTPDMDRKWSIKQAEIFSELLSDPSNKVNKQNITTHKKHIFFTHILS